MRISHLLFVLAGISFNAYAGPGDDIWKNIEFLQRSLKVALANIQTLEKDTASIHLTLNEQSNKLQQLQQNLDALNSNQIGKFNEHSNSLQQLQQSIDTLNTNQIARHYIGEAYRGGVVFHVDATGQHGLIASKMDVNKAGVQWRNGASGNKVTNARGDGVGAGETNTRLIISQQTIDNQKGTFAALQASNFQVLEDGLTPCKTPISDGAICYGGWYLPSALELQLIYKNLYANAFSSFSPDFYWSSTERNVAEAWLLQFTTGELSSSNKSNTVGKVRPIAQF